MARMSPAPDEPTLGLRLRELREAAGLSREELAYRAGTTAETLLQIELHGREPRYWTAWRIAQVLAVKMEDLAGELPKVESVVVEVFPRRASGRSTSTSSQSQQADEPAAGSRAQWKNQPKRATKAARKTSGNTCFWNTSSDQREDRAA